MEPKTAPASLIWWILWFAILFSLVTIYTLLGQTTASPTASTGPLRFLPILPVMVSGFIRWMLLPKALLAAKAMGLFLIGLALAEACVILGIFLAPDLKQTYFVLGLLGVAQFAPFFAARFR